MTASVFTKEYKIFRVLLQKHRLKMSITQKEVARHLKRPQSFVSKYESGERRLDVIEFLAIAEFLNIDLVSFLNSMKEESNK
jgi:transcriptional regulator with XRE-family HTH domain